jgi:hypothetical protein
MKKILSSLTITYKSKRVTVEVWEATRGGTKSPISQYFRFQNRWITPFEQDLRVKLLLSDLFKLTYGPTFETMGHIKHNSFIDSIPKDIQVGIPYPPIPMKVD